MFETFPPSTPRMFLSRPRRRPSSSSLSRRVVLRRLARVVSRGRPAAPCRSTASGTIETDDRSRPVVYPPRDFPRFSRSSRCARARVVASRPRRRRGDGARETVGRANDRHARCARDDVAVDGARRRGRGYGARTRDDEDRARAGTPRDGARERGRARRASDARRARRRERGRSED